MKHIKLDDYLFNYQVFLKNIKHMYLRYENKVIKVTCNKNISQNAILNFIIKHKKWILNRHLVNQIDLYDDQYMYIWGKKYPIKYSLEIPNYLQVTENSILINQPFLDIKKVELFYKELILNEVSTIMTENADHINNFINTSSLTFKSQLMKSRLGSCIKSKKVIKLNSLLARLDKRYTKLVLFHELTHLVIGNHSEKFHILLEKLYPNHKLINKQLIKKTREFAY